MGSDEKDILKKVESDRDGMGFKLKKKRKSTQVIEQRNEDGNNRRNIEEDSWRSQKQMACEL